MCKSKFKITRWLLGLMVLAVIVGMGPAAYAQPALGVGLQLNGGNVVHVGNSYTGAITVTNTCSPTCSETVNSISVVPACTVVPTAGTVCSSPDAGVITIDSATSVSGCGAVTWTVTGGPGTFTLTPSSGVVLANGLPTPSSCALSFGFTVNTLPSVDADTTSIGSLDTGGSAAAAGNVTGSVTGAGGVGDTDTPFTFTCGVQVDKQISCDGGATWSDAGFADGATNGCVGKNGVADIKVQYVAKNTSDSGIGLLSCTIGESNTNLGPGVTASFPIANGATTGNLATSASALVCETARGTSEPDTGSIDCTCNVPLLTQPHATDTDTATFGCCGVQVDKQVSCNGAAFVDVGFADGATGSCSAVIGQPLALQYLIKNTGDFPVSCTISDDQSNANNIFVGPSGTVAKGVTSSAISNTNVSSCLSTLSANEPNTATASCTCDGGALGTTTVSDQDTASFNCTANPSFTVSKTCTPTATTGSFDLAVTVTNTDNATGSQLSCTATDAVFPGSCPASGTSVPGPSLVTQPLSVAASPANCDVNTGANCSTGTLTGSLTGQTQTTCDVATVTCTSGGVTLDAKTASAECPVTPPGGCFTRTPGYWGTHPPNTLTVLGAGITVCGVTLTNVNAPTSSGSAIEDLCSQNANEAKAVAPPTSTQELQLVRQCTAAALNLAVSNQAQLDCNATNGGFPGITAKFASCCTNANATCNSGLTGAQIDATGCEPFLDAFNNQFDNAPFPQGSGLSDMPADSSACQIASGDRQVNQPRNYGKK